MIVSFNAPHVSGRYGMERGQRLRMAACIKASTYGLQHGVWTAETGRGGDGDDRPIRDQGGGFVWGKDAGKGYGLISNLED